MFHSHSVTEAVSTLVTTEVSYDFFFFMYVKKKQKNLLRQNNVRTSRQQFQPPRTIFILFLTENETILGGNGRSRDRREQSPGVHWPSSHARPRNRCSLVVSASRESHTDESTSRLRAVPKVTKLLSAMAGSQRRHQTVQTIKSEEARGWTKKNKKNWAHSTRQRGDREKKSSN